MHQNEVTSCIVSYFVNKYKRGLKINEVKDFADEIKIIFPNEDKSTYYIPRCGSQNPRGKLYDKNVNSLQQYRKHGYLAKCCKRLQNEPVLSSFAINTNVEEDNAEETRIWLKNSLLPWSAVQNKWYETINYRTKWMMEAENTEQILNYWPRIKDANGYLLIEIDFIYQFGEKVKCLYNLWTDFLAKILVDFKNNIREENAKKLLKLCLLPETSEDSKNYIVILLLFNILLPRRISVKANQSITTIKFWKPSILEAQQAFVTIISTVGNLEKTILDRRDKYFALGFTFFSAR